MVTEVLKQNPNFELIEILPTWSRRGDSTFACGRSRSCSLKNPKQTKHWIGDRGYYVLIFVGPKCVRALPQDMTKGFFAACFVRKHQPTLQDAALEPTIGKASSQNKRVILSQTEPFSTKRHRPQPAELDLESKHDVHSTNRDNTATLTKNVSPSPTPNTVTSSRKAKKNKRKKQNKKSKMRQNSIAS